ncbi:MAG: alpha/beta hydrolase [Deltaproteobacteria bacterium]|nr:alpha/beta hydrolase [Deltaproteobacteria bacterium]
MTVFLVLLQFGVLAFTGLVEAQTQRVLDLPTRHGVTVRLLILTPKNPRAALVILPGGLGGLQISLDGKFQGEGKGGNFLLRARHTFVSQGLLVAIADAPSDRRTPPYLGGYRTRPEHATDMKAVIGWVRRETSIPVWVVGNSSGTLSAAFIAIRLGRGNEGPDGLVLTSTMFTHDPGLPGVLDMPLQKIRIPTLIVHHKQDGCKYCRYGDLPRLTHKLSSVPYKEVLTFDGGTSVGDPCEPKAYHGFNGIVEKVGGAIADWIVQHSAP